MRIKTVLQLLVACFGAGLLMTLIGWTPEDVYRGVLELVKALGEIVADLFRTAFTGEVFSVFLAGASVILPLAAIVLGVRWLRRRRR